jgi:hypothetical protein
MALRNEKDLESEFKYIKHLIYDKPGSDFKIKAIDALYLCRTATFDLYMEDKITKCEMEHYIGLYRQYMKELGYDENFGCRCPR